MLAVHKAIATVFGSGYSPFAPGTAGSIVAAILFYFLFPIIDDHLLFLGIIVILTLLSNISVTAVEKKWEHDDGRIVIDELLGLWVTLLFIPFSVLNIVLALVLFRFFDILKPLGIRAVDEKMESPMGVILDDILAGIYANIVLQLLVRFVLPSFILFM